jgi:prepilin-type N-terminal cleavage/methylation domain-containing protein
MNDMRRGLTLIEIIVAVALISILSALGFLALNPVGQLASARNSQRTFHLNGLMNGIRQNMADTSGGGFTCASGSLPTSTPKKMATGAGNYDIAPCLVPTYLPNIPFDPSASGAHYASNSDYDTGYTIIRNASTGQVTVNAPAAELNKTISITR